MTTPPAPPPEAAPPAPEALPHNPSATIDNVDIYTSRTEKSSPKRQPSPAEEEQPRKHRRRQRSRAADWTTLHSADTKEEARTWMHKNTTTNMVWVYATGNHATVFKCAEHADCSFRCKISKAQVRVPVPKVRCPVNSCYDTFANPVGFLFALACKVTYNRGMSPPVFAAHFFVECVFAKTPTGKVHVERACALR